MSGEPTLPEGVRLLHVGPPKTGTSSIQAAFHEARDQLRVHGVHYAGRARRPKQAGREFLARDGRTRGEHWQALLDDVHGAGDNRVCISNESFANCDDALAEELVQALGGDSVHVVLVARPFDALLPSHWQQSVRNQPRMEVSYEEWLQVVLGEDSDAGYHRNFWRPHDLEEQIRRWSAATSRERVTVVVLREGDHDYLLRVFEQLLALPDGVLEAPRDRANSSLTLTRAELVRALDREADRREWKPEWYERDLKGTLADAVRLLPRNPVERAIELPPWAATAVGELNDRRADLLEGTSVRVIGDPGAMRPGRRDVVAEGTSEEVVVPLDVAAGALAEAVDELFQREVEHRRRIRRLRRRLRRASASARPRPTGRLRGLARGRGGRGR